MPGAPACQPSDCLHIVYHIYQMFLLERFYNWKQLSLEISWPSVYELAPFSWHRFRAVVLTQAKCPSFCRDVLGYSRETGSPHQIAIC